MTAGRLDRGTRIAFLLDACYCHPRLINWRDPVDEAVFILLSTMTTEVNYVRAYRSLRQRWTSWDQVRRAPIRAIRSAIAIGGLSSSKSRLLKGLLNRIFDEWGTDRLDFMRTWPTDAIRSYFASLPGLGYKSASCIVAYSFDRDVCPIDTHTYRVAVRLGLLSADSPRQGESIHRWLEASLPAGGRLNFHLNAVAHGRRRCRLSRPTCAGCPVRRFCILPGAGRFSRLPVRER